MPGARGGDPKIVVAYDASSSLKHGVTNILYFATLFITFTTDSNETGRSAKGVLRGLHYQIQQPQGKLVRVTQGEVFDVAVDIRKSSPTFGKWVGEILSAQNNKQIWVPPGFAHGFLVLSETAEFLYKTTDFWAPQFERCIAWNDPAIGIKWQLRGIIPTLSDKDAQGKSLAQAD